MGDTLTTRDLARWRAIKILKAMDLTWGEIVNKLTAEGLLECQNHTKTRTSQAGEEFCTTCENTATQFWKRNITRLRDEEADMLEVRWQLLEGLAWVARVCRDKHVRDVEITTERLEAGETGEDGKPGEPVKTLTTRRETRIDRGLLKLYAHVRERIAKVSGLDIEDPDPLAKTQRKLLYVYERDDSDGTEPPAN